MAPERLIGLINLVATIPFSHADRPANEILGHVYEYFLGQFALAGEKGGQYFTQRSIVSLIVEMLEPNQGRVDDPAMAPADSSSNPSASSRSTAAGGAPSPSTGRRAIRPPGASPR